MRPSTSTKSLSEKISLKPRAETAHLLASILATSMPGTWRRASGMEVAPERRMSSRVRAAMAAEDWKRFSSFFETEKTSKSISSSSESWARLLSLP